MASISNQKLLQLFPHLPASLSSFQTSPRQRQVLPFSELAPGIPLGALTEISGRAGSGKTEVVLKFLAENPTLQVAWIEKQFTLYPCRMAQCKVSLNRVVFIETPLEYLWGAQQVLRSQIFKVVVLVAPIPHETILRRLQIAAERSNSALILLTETPTLQGAWPISIQAQVKREERSGGFVLNVFKKRGQGLSSLRGSDAQLSYCSIE